MRPEIWIWRDVAAVKVEALLSRAWRAPRETYLATVSFSLRKAPEGWQIVEDVYEPIGYLRR